MDYQENKENIPESLITREILMEARRKLLRYQRKSKSTEVLKDYLIDELDKCPECDCLVQDNFKCIDNTRKIFQCQNCKNLFTPEITEEFYCEKCGEFSNPEIAENDIEHQIGG